MKPYSHLIIFSLLFVGYSCAPKHETKSLYFEGKLISEYQYYISDGDTIADGVYRSFYKNGNLKEEINYKDDKQVGNANYYWDNGKLESQLVFINDKLVSQIGNWDYNGNRIDSFTVLNGKGVLTEYYKNGKMRRTTEMRDSIENGKTIEYDKNGKITSITTYVYGYEHGEAMRVVNGNIVTYFYSYGKENGDFFITDSLNNLLTKGKLRDKILVDTTYHYHQNKKVKTIVIYKSENFTKYDSVRLGLKESDGILAVFQPYIGSPGIIHKVIEFNSSGQQIKEEVVEE